MYSSRIDAVCKVYASGWPVAFHAYPVLPRAARGEVLLQARVAHAMPLRVSAYDLQPLLAARVAHRLHIISQYNTHVSYHTVSACIELNRSGRSKKVELRPITLDRPALIGSRKNKGGARRYTTTKYHTEYFVVLHTHIYI